MAENKTRATRLIRTDDSIPGVVKFYDCRETDVAKAYIGAVELALMCEEREFLEAIPSCIVRAACHGYTQNILDSSNKLEGDARVAFVRKAIDQVNAGGWASTPIDEDAARAKAISALVKTGFFTQAQAEATVAAQFNASRK